MSFETDESEAVEFFDYGNNEADLYRRRKLPTQTMLLKRVAAGTYDSRLAPKAWQSVADAYVQAYDIEFGSGRGSLTITTSAVRKMVAAMLAEQFEAAVQAGEWDEEISALMTKKRKKELGLA